MPAVSCLAAIVASLISSRVRTFNTAQQISGLVLVPVWGKYERANHSPADRKALGQVLGEIERRLETGA